jgi:hypothetical protein
MVGTEEQGLTGDQQLCPAGARMVVVPAGADVDTSIRGLDTGEVELGAWWAGEGGLSLLMLLL